MNQDSQYAQMLDLSPEIIFALDAEHRILYANRAVEAATGHPVADFSGKSLSETDLETASAERLHQALARAEECDTAQEVSFEWQAPSGMRYYNAHIVKDVNSPTLLMYARDISAQHKMTQELTRSATTDSLTGLYNKQQFFALGRKDLARAKRYLKPLSLMVLDLDRFKTLNDTFGQPLGDHVLIRVARALDTLLRTSDCVYRFDGGTFIVSMVDTPLEQAQLVAERIRRRIEGLEIHIADLTMKVTASIGISQLLLDDDSIELLLKRAEQGLYQAKTAGRNRCVALIQPS